MISLLSAAKQTGIYTIPEAARYAKMHAKSLRNWFGIVKAAVIDGEPAAAVLGIDFYKPVAELNIAP